MKTIKILIGLPRSGKSTWVINNKTNEVVISVDDLRYIVYNQRFWSDGEPLMWSVRGIMLKYLMQQGVDIIIDETNTTIDRRKSIIKLAKQYGYHIIGKYFQMVRIEDCIKRAEKTNQLDLIPIINIMKEKLESPSMEEGFDEIKYV